MSIGVWPYTPLAAWSCQRVSDMVDALFTAAHRPLLCSAQSTSIFVLRSLHAILFVCRWWFFFFLSFYHFFSFFRYFSSVSRFAGSFLFLLHVFGCRSKTFSCIFYVETCALLYVAAAQNAVPFLFVVASVAGLSSMWSPLFPEPHIFTVHNCSVCCVKKKKTHSPLAGCWHDERIRCALSAAVVPRAYTQTHLRLPVLTIFVWENNVI